MLTQEAFNALLKTLEEPPPHAILILATTDVHKVPLTIISRCQRFDFRRVPSLDVVEKLKKLSLEELIAVNDIKSSLVMLGQLIDDGKEASQIHSSLIEITRVLILIKSKAGDGSEFGDSLKERLDSIAEKFTIERLIFIAKIMANVDFRDLLTPALPLEIAIMESILGPQTGVSKPDLIQTNFSREQQTAHSPEVALGKNSNNTIEKFSNPSTRIEHSTQKSSEVIPYELMNVSSHPSFSTLGKNFSNNTLTPNLWAR